MGCEPGKNMIPNKKTDTMVKSPVEQLVIEPCPFCGSKGEEFEPYCFRVMHKPGCWLVQQGFTDHLKTWISGAGDINFWNTRAL
jgi:hypothetical protein